MIDVNVESFKKQRLDELNEKFQVACLTEKLLRKKFDCHFLHYDKNGKRFIVEDEFLYGPHKITWREYDLLMHLTPAITVDYILKNNDSKEFLGTMFRSRFSIEQTLAFWSVVAMGFLLQSESNPVLFPVLYGMMTWFVIEQLYHRAGHRKVSSESQMLFAYHLHGDHHLAPDQPGATVSSIPKNLALASGLASLFQVCGLPNPMLAMASLTVMYMLYEFMHWYSHTTTSDQARKVPMLGPWLADGVGNHRRHHREGDTRYAIFAGSLGVRCERYIESMYSSVTTGGTGLYKPPV